MPDGDRPGRAPGRSPPRGLAWASLLFLAAALAAVVAALAGGWDAWAGIAAASATGWQVRPLPLAGSVACGAAALWISGVTWATVFRAAGGRLEVPEAAAAWLGSNLGRYLPGKIWQVTGLVGYARARDASGAGALATLLMFQGVMLASGAGLGVAALGGTAFAGAGPWPVLLGALGVAAAVSPPAMRVVMRLGRRLLRESAQAQAAPPGWRPILPAVAGGLLAWAFHGVGFWLLLRGLVAENPLDPFAAAGVFSASYVVGYLAVFAPGGMIVREGAMTSLLGVVAAMSVGPAAAVALAARLWTTAAELVALGGGLALVRLARMRRRPPVR